MPAKLLWTPQRDHALIHLRQRGQSWATIANTLGISRNAAQERARRVGARLPRRTNPSLLEDPHDRPPLPPGHPRSWAILTHGTTLAQTPYPRPGPIGRTRAPVVGEAC